MSKKPKISAIICTFNREEYLGGAIESLINQTLDEYEIIVVDNASSDRTKEIATSYPQVTYIYEPVQGLSIARNTGAKIAKADILAYLDDDAEASKNWLDEIYKAYEKNEKLAIAGGKVSLIWKNEQQKPTWLSDNLAASLGLYNLGDEEIYITNPELTPRGLNYSLRKSFLESMGGFNINLGRMGKNLLSNEELYMTEIAIKNGWQVAYLPLALVAHNIAPERLKLSWFFQRNWWQGVSEYYRQQVDGSFTSKNLLEAGENILRGVYKSIKNLPKGTESMDNILYAYGQIGYINAALQNWGKSNIKK